MPMIAFARFEVLRTLRTPKFLGFLIVMPVGLYLLFADVITGPNTARAAGATGTMIAIGTYAATASAMYATGPELALDRGNGWLRQLFTTPLTFTRWMIAKLLLALAISLPGTVAVGVTAVLADGVHLHIGQWIALLLIMLAAAVPFAFLGHMIGLLLSNQAASAGQVLVLFTLSFLGGVFIPSTALPEAARQIAEFTPTSHALTLAQAAASATPVTGVLWRRDGATGS
jgi:ABC-2 type transport system permease protein